MNNLFVCLMLIILGSCTKDTKHVKALENGVEHPPNLIISNDYELILPEEQDDLLILFPCFPCDAEHTQAEFNIYEMAANQNIAVLSMNFNQHLWLTDEESKQLEQLIISTIQEYKIDSKNTFIGGYSSGGNVSLLLTDYLQSTHSVIQPKGIFVVDSPVDLFGLYKNAQNNLKQNFSEVAVNEANSIINYFDSKFDNENINFENTSPYLFKTNSTKNLSNLKDIKVRFYSEPDTTWWRENRDTDYEDMNAFYIEALVKDLQLKYGEQSIKYIQTQNKGFKSNGDRHPHSWSIVDQNDLINWMME